MTNLGISYREDIKALSQTARAVGHSLKRFQGGEVDGRMCLRIRGGRACSSFHAGIRALHK